MTDEAIPAATLVVWRDPHPGEAQARDTGRRTLRQHGLRRRRDRVSRRAGRCRRQAAGRGTGPPGRCGEGHRHPRNDRGNRRRPGADGRGRCRPRPASCSERCSTARISPSCSTDHGLTLDLDALTPFARWMPAFKQPRKFDTLFFLAPRPGGRLAAAVRSRANATPPNGPARPSCSTASNAAMPAPSSRPSATSSGSPSTPTSTRRWPTPAPTRSRRSSPGSRRSTACAHVRIPDGSRLSGAVGAAGDRLSRLTAQLAAMRKGPRHRRRPLLIRLPRLEAASELAEMLRQMLVHFEHGALVDAKDLLELVVGKNFPLVIRVLQVVLANVIPHLRHDLATRQRGSTRRSRRVPATAVTGRASPPPALRPVPFAIWPSCCSEREIERDSPLCARGRQASMWLI